MPFCLAAQPGMKECSLAESRAVWCGAVSARDDVEVREGLQASMVVLGCTAETVVKTFVVEPLHAIIQT